VELHQQAFRFVGDLRGLFGPAFLRLDGAFPSNHFPVILGKNTQLPGAEGKVVLHLTGEFQEISLVEKPLERAKRGQVILPEAAHVAQSPRGKNAGAPFPSSVGAMVLHGEVGKSQEQIASADGVRGLVHREGVVGRRNAE